MSMNANTPSPTSPWEEFDSDLDESVVGIASADQEAAIEDALELQMISIRLQKSLIRQLKLIAHFHNVGYQPLIRDLLGRFARSEIRDIVTKLEKASAETSKMEAVDDFFAREHAEPDKKQCA
jgi:predicted DNA binding CopG/RHH family protein